MTSMTAMSTRSGSASPLTLLAPLALLAVASITAGCTSPTPNYCDETTPCTTPGTICQTATKTCVASDGGADLTPGHDMPGADTAVDTLPVDAPDQPKPNGEACGADTHCASKHCVDSVCCDSACDGVCRTCKAAASLGSCVNAAPGSDPGGSCAGQDPGCSGSCDGSGACDFSTVVDKLCGVSTCVSGSLTQGKCDAQGACQTGTTSCGGYVCADGTSCKSSCGGKADCLAPAVCDTSSSKCIAQQANGAPCGTNDELCASGQCVDGFCCGAASCGECESCGVSGHEGSCFAARESQGCGAGLVCALAEASASTCKAGTCTTSKTPCAPYACNALGTICGTTCADDTGCAAGAFCDKTPGKCLPKKGNGVACLAGNECTSTLCTPTEKVCCDKACGGACETCKGKAACTLRIKDAACVPAGSAGCQDDPFTSFISTPVCNGTTSGCDGASITSCGAYKCGTGATCRTACTQHDQCSSGVCQLWDAPTGTCVPAADICYVKPGGNGNGTQASPYGSIAPCLGGTKTIIGLANGTYSGDLTIGRSVLLIGYETPITLGVPQDAAVVKAIIKPASIGLTVTTSAKVRLVGLQINGYIGNPLLTGNNLDLYIETSVIAHTWGPGILVTNSNLKLKDVGLGNCAFDAIRHEVGTLTLERVTVLFNVGRAIRFESGTLTARDLTISLSASGLLTYAATVDIDRAVVTENTGIGLELSNSTRGMVVNLVASGNGGAAVDINNNSFVSLVHATLVDNAGSGVELACDPTRSSTILNSIIWNGPADATSSGEPFSGTCNLQVCAVNKTIATCTNCINSVPLFTAPLAATPDYSLASGSPCIDMGLDSYSGASIPTQDVLGNPRPKKLLTKPTTLDLGAYERQTP